MMILAGGGVAALSPILGLLGAVLAIVGIGGAAVAYFKAAYARGTIETLKDSNAAQAERIRLLEEDQSACNSRLTAVEAENSTLRTVVSGTEAIQGLAKTLTEQHHEVMARVTEVVETIGAHVALTEAGMTSESPRRRPAAKKAAPRANTGRTTRR